MACADPPPRDPLDVAFDELAVVQYALQHGDTADAVGRLSGVVGDLTLEVKALRKLNANAPTVQGALQS